MLFLVQSISAVLRKCGEVNRDRRGGRIGLSDDTARTVRVCEVLTVSESFSDDIYDRIVAEAAAWTAGDNRIIFQEFPFQRRA